MMILKLIFRNSRMILKLMRKMKKFLGMLSLFLLSLGRPPSLVFLVVYPLTNHWNPMGHLRDLQQGRGKISTGESDSVHGENGRLKFVTQERGSESGLELSTHAEDAARAYDAEARRIRGKKAKVNFPEEAPVAPQKPSVKPDPEKAFSVDNMDAFLDSVQGDIKAVTDEEIISPIDDRELTNAVFSNVEGFAPFTPSDDVPQYFSSDQGSNSYGYSEFGWVDQYPEISSMLSAALEDESYYVEDANPTKRLKSNSQNVVAASGNSGNTPSEELANY
ncbi:Ethylene-responsive transcription factor [Quillaja saponaria]|uniref:Ethylene-responsive transcription factor n=1 Tax=Quillaja saponaria TaxID=32244 RepID=A0AAD7KMC0_QUISA|nr:Ethylene-responsive transcription factor [Quillaja saponaria]